MSSITRRSALKALLAGLPGLAAGRWLTAPVTAAGHALAPRARIAAGGPFPDLVVARGRDPEALVEHALAALGGIERFVWPGADVVIKPNAGVATHSFEYAATTNPWVAGALVRLCRAAGARRVRVLDQPFRGSARAAYARSGIGEQVLLAGGELHVPRPERLRSVALPGGRTLKRWTIYADVLAADVLINVPVAKQHGLAGLTLGLKNLMGVIGQPALLHGRLEGGLADLASRIRPALTVIDAVRVLAANGPVTRSLADVQRLDTLIASADPVAADSYAALLLGRRPEDVAGISAAAAAGLGQSAVGALRVVEVRVGG